MTSEESQSEFNRRDFLKIAAAAAASAQLGAGCSDEKPVHFEPSEKQKGFKRKEKSQVSISACADYNQDLKDAIVRHKEHNGLVLAKNKNVFLKMNLVDFRPDKPLTTDAAVVRAAVLAAAECGARSVTIGDGPALNRDTEYLLSSTGIATLCKDLGVKFVDLNIDDLVEVENLMGFTREKSFFLPESIATSDFVISMPKLKTHRWSKVTASMKNLFGVIPGRAYGFPKNFLHVNGITPSIIDLNLAVKPSMAIVDAIVSMEGHGPLDGEAKPTGFIVTGQDLCAVDAVCARAMMIDPLSVPYIKLAGQVLGNTDPAAIEIEGEPLEKVAQKFQLPRTFGSDGNPVKNPAGSSDTNAT